MMDILYVILLFFSGSLMFSQWIGLLLKKDLRKMNDGNPGAANLWQTAGAGWGLLGVVLDFMKGYLPLAILIWTGALSGFILVPAAIAPVLGHAFSPFLKFKGGKSKSVSFGIWSALTDFEVSVVYALILALLLLFVKLFGINQNRRTDAWMAIVGMLILGGYLMVRGFSTQIILIWILNLMVFIITNSPMLLETFRRSIGDQTHSWK